LFQISAKKDNFVLIKTKLMEQTKPWYLSKTIWGVIIAFAGFVANQFFKVQIPDVASDVATILGLVVALYGRIKAESVIIP
jgi:hypothetical protein